MEFLGNQLNISAGVFVTTVILHTAAANVSLSGNLATTRHVFDLYGQCRRSEKGRYRA